MMREIDKASIIRGFKELIDKDIIDYKIYTECKEIDITCPGDKVQKFKRGEVTTYIEIVY